MNDFTKEELKILLLEIDISISRHEELLKIAPSYEDLKFKIQSMIDNYSEENEDDFICSQCDDNYRKLIDGPKG